LQSKTLQVHITKIMRTSIRNLRFIIAAALLMPAAASSAYDLEFLSQNKLSRDPHAALLRSPAINVLYMYSESNNKHYMEFDFGAKIPGITLRNVNGVDIEIGGSGGVFSRFELFSQSFNFVDADFNGTLYTDVRYKRFVFETSVYHTSSHIGDEYILYHHVSVRNTGYEAIRHYTTYTGEYCGVSIGFDYKLRRYPERLILPNPSIFIGARLDLLSAGIPVFVECEVEVIAGGYLPNVGIRAGVYLKYLFNTIVLKKPSSGREPHELAVSYYRGYSKMGYFYNRRETLILFGPTYRY